LELVLVSAIVTEMEISRLWLLVAGMVWVTCWDGRMVNGQGMLC